MVQEYHDFPARELAEIFGRRAGEPTPTRPFDLGEALVTYARSMPAEAKHDYHRWDEATWSKEWLEVDGVLGREEAHFWFVAGTTVERIKDTSATRLTPRTLRARRYDGILTKAEAIERLRAWHDAFTAHYRSNRFYTQVYLARCLRELLPVSDVVEVLFEALDARWVVAFSQYLGPIPEDPDEVAKMAGLVDLYVARRDLRDVTNRNLVSRLAPMARHEAECRRFLEWEISQKKRPTTHTWVTLGALRDDADFDAFLKRLDPPMARKWVVALIARYGLDACERIYQRVSASRTKGALKDLPISLGLIHSPRVVPSFLYMLLDPDASLEAEAWLLSEGERAIFGLMQACSHRGRLAEPAIELLRRIHAEGEGSASIESMLDDLTPSERRTVVEKVLEHRELDLPKLPETEYPTWLSELSSRRKPQGLPRFVSLKNLTPLYTSSFEYELDRPAVWGIVDLLRNSSLEERDLDAWRGIREDLEFESMRDFAWRLFIEWTRHDAPMDHLWCLDVLAFVGDDEVVMRLKPYFDDWPARRLHDLAYRGIEVLERIGTDAAMMAISQLAHSSKYKSVKMRAAARLADLAAKTGIEATTLEDQVIDDCGLDEDGELLLDYGPRHFRLRFDDAFKPIFVSSEDGKISKSLPRRRKSDNQDLAEMAAEEYELIKDRLADVVKTQKIRLEEAMISGRRWSTSAFVTTMVQHPLMRHFAQRLIWACFDEDERVRATFRVDQELGFANWQDENFSPERDDRIGIVHPLEIPPESRARWSSLLAEYEIIPPFEQMERQTYRPGNKKTLGEGFTDVELPAGWFRGHMTRRQWIKARPEESGYIRVLRRYFPLAGVSAEVAISPGLYAPDYKRDVDQKILNLRFVDAATERAVPYGLVEPIAFSETMRDVHSIVDRVRIETLSNKP